MGRTRLVKPAPSRAIKLQLGLTILRRHRFKAKLLAAPRVERIVVKLTGVLELTEDDCWIADGLRALHSSVGPSRLDRYWFVDDPKCNGVRDSAGRQQAKSVGPLSDRGAGVQFDSRAIDRRRLIRLFVEWSQPDGLVCLLNFDKMGAERVRVEPDGVGVLQKVAANVDL